MMLVRTGSQSRKPRENHRHTGTESSHIAKRVSQIEAGSSNANRGHVKASAKKTVAMPLSSGRERSEHELSERPGSVRNASS